MGNSVRFYAGVCSLVFLLVSGSFQSPAVQAQGEVNDSVEEIIVTASRRQESLQNVAIAVSVIDLTDFTRGGQTNLADILPFVSGVVFADEGGTARNDVYIRGINATGAAGIGIYIDDISYGSSQQFAAGGSPIDGTLFDLDHMEVLKGPQGTLYGASAMGGLLAFKTRAPSLSDWTGSISADLSATNHGGLNQLYRVTANGPLVKDTTGVSFAAFWKDKTGYIDNVVIPQKGVDDYEYYGGSFNILVAPSEKFQIKFQGLYQISTQVGLATIQADNVTGEPVLGKFKTGQLGLFPTQFEATVVGATMNYDFGWAELTSVTSYQDMNYSQGEDITFEFAGLLDFFIPANAPHTKVLFAVDAGFDKFTQEMRLTSESNSKFEWLLGGFYSTETGRSNQVLVATPPEPDFLDVALPSKYVEKAIFATGTYYLSQKIDASFGLRHSKNEATLEIRAVGPLVAPVPLIVEKQNVTTYLFNMRYRPSDNLAVYGRVASGFRPGGANAVAFDAQGVPLAPPFFLADTLWSYEIGVKGKSADGLFSYDLAAFHIDWTDYQIFIVRNGIGVIGNAAKATSDGAEATLNISPSEGLTISATASYVDAKLALDEPDLGGAKGARLPHSSKFSGNVRFNYDFDIGEVPSFIGASYRYTGKFPVGFEGVTIDGDFFPPSAPRYTNKSYGTVDIRAGFSTNHFDVSFYVNNLFDNYSFTNIATNFQGPATGTPLRPRTVGVVLTKKFD